MAAAAVATQRDLTEAQKKALSNLVSAFTEAMIVFPDHAYELSSTQVGVIQRICLPRPVYQEPASARQNFTHGSIEATLALIR